MNTFYCSHYRSYNKGTPSYLHDRPREFILHCLESGRLLCDLFYQELPAKGKAFFQWWVSLIIWASVTKFTLEMNMKCQNTAAMTGAKQVICANTFLLFLKNFRHGHSMHYHWYTLSPFLNLDKTVISSLKENVLPDATPTKKTKQNCQ